MEDYHEFKSEAEFLTSVLNFKLREDAPENRKIAIEAYYNKMLKLIRDIKAFRIAHQEEIKNEGYDKLNDIEGDAVFYFHNNGFVNVLKYDMEFFEKMDQETLNNDFDEFYLETALYAIESMESPKEKMIELYQRIGNKLTPNHKAIILKATKDKELIKKELSALLKEDVSPYFVTELIGIVGDSNLAQEYSKTDAYKKMVKNNDFGTPEFLLAKFNGDYKKFYHFFMKHYAKLRPGDINASQKNKMIEMLVESKTKYGRYLIVKKPLKLQISEQRWFANKVYIDEKFNIKKIKNRELKSKFLSRILSPEELMEHYKKYRKVLTKVEKEDIIEGLGDKRVELMQELIANEEDYSIVRDLASKIDDKAAKPKVKNIKTLSEISIEELKNGNIDYVELEGDYCSGYSRRQMLEIKEKMDELLEGIPYSDGTVESDQAVFKAIYKKVAAIKYDYHAVSKLGEKDENLQKHCRTLYNGLVQGKCVCRGYAEILHRALQERGIESQIVSGGLRTEEEEKKIKEYSINPQKKILKLVKDTKVYKHYANKYYKKHVRSHAWNQVKIGDAWFNCDATNYKNPETALMTDEEFNSRRSKYYSNTPSKKESVITLEEIRSAIKRERDNNQSI